VKKEIEVPKEKEEVKKKEGEIEDDEDEDEEESKPAVAKEKKDKKKDKEEKPVLEREYIIPLRRKVWKVPKYKRAKKAIRVIREFLTRHMKVDDRDLKKIKIDKWLNQEIWFRGIKKPPAKIKVKASKFESGEVKVELVDIPDKVKFDIAREEKKKKAGEKVVKKEVVKPIEEKKTKEEEKEEEEKEEAVVEAGFKKQKEEAGKEKHTSKVKPAKQMQIHRKAMKR